MFGRELVAGLEVGMPGEALLAILPAKEILDCLTDPAAVVDQHGNLIYCNPAWVKITGADPTESIEHYAEIVSGRSLLIRPDGSAAEPGNLAIIRALRGEDVDDSELFVRRISGERAWITTTARPIRDPNGTILGALAVSRDVTSVRLLELEHERQRAHLQSVVQNAPVGIMLFSTDDFRILEHNPAALALASGEHQQTGTVVGLTVEEATDQKTGSAIEAMFRQVVETREALEIPEVRAIVVPDPEPRFFRGSITPLLDIYGNPEQLLVCSIDITEQVRAREEVQRLARAAEARAAEFETVINSMADAVIITDARTGAVMWNPAYARTLGTPQLGETSASRVARFQLRYWDGQPVPPEDMAAVRAVETGTPAFGDYFMSSLDGSEVYLRVSASPLVDETGQTTGAVVVLRDVTESREIERQKDEFLSLVSHELRTPVTIIRGFTQLLRRSLESADVQETQRRLDIIDRQVGQLTALINDLLDLSRVEQGRFHCELSPIDYHALASMVVLDMSDLNPGHEFALSAPEAVQVIGDSARLRQVLVNLIENAIQHGPEGTAVRVTVRNEGDDVVTYVRDDGPALPEAERERVFERFYRIKPGPVHNGGTLGLGLFVSHAIVQAHGGRIWVPDDDGSTYAFAVHQFELPRVE